MIPATVSNPWEAQRRAAKAKRLIEAIDYALAQLRESLPEIHLQAVEGMGSAGWASAAISAGVPMPSPETQAVVVATYVERVKAAEIARCISGALRVSALAKVG